MTMRTRMILLGVWIAAAALIVGWMNSAKAQIIMSGSPVVPVGYCQIATLSSSVQITASSCVRASFTGSGSGTNLTTTSVTGIIKVGDGIAGTGVPSGTTIVSQTSGTVGGAGVYVTSVATTSSSASLTAGGVPPGANLAYIQAEAQIVRYRDDGGVPTASIGQPIASTGTLVYGGTMSALRFIEATSSAKLNISFYKSP